MKQNHHYTFETKAVLYSGLLTFALLCILFAVGGLAPSAQNHWPLWMQTFSIWTSSPISRMSFPGKNHDRLYVWKNFGRLQHCCFQLLPKFSL